jgi:hypothetical protein
MGDNEQRDPVQTKLDLLLERFQEISNRLAVQSVQLFGAPEDQFTAGHLPMLKKEVSNLETRVTTIESVHAKESGRSGIVVPFLRWVGSAALLTAGALLQWFLARPK